jgi:hypothetical protein
MPDKTPREQLGVDLPDREPVEQAEVEVEQPEATRPEGLPEKFGSMDDFVSSYQSLEEELRQRGKNQNEMQAQIDQLMEMQQQQQIYQQPVYQQPQQNQQLAEQLMSAYEVDPIGTMVFLAQQAADERTQQMFATFQQQYQPQQNQQQMMAGELLASNAERLLESKYPDWNQYAPQVGDFLEKNQHVLEPALGSLDQTAKVLEAVYKQIKYDDVVTQLESNGSDQTRMKQQAQTVSGGAGRPGQQNPDDEKIDRIVAAAKNTSYAAFRGGS